MIGQCKGITKSTNRRCRFLGCFAGFCATHFEVNTFGRRAKKGKSAIYKKKKIPKNDLESKILLDLEK